MGGSDAPLIYMTFGTVLGFMSIAAEAYRMALKAVQRTRARVLLTVGRRFDASTLGPVPAHVHVEAWVDQARVLERADVVVCHGGSGTTLGALAAGVPLVMVPLFADQFENGRRVAAAGAALVVETRVPEITSSIEDVLGDGRYRDRARAIAAEMSATPTVGHVLGAHACPASAGELSRALGVLVRECEQSSPRSRRPSPAAHSRQRAHTGAGAEPGTRRRCAPRATDWRLSNSQPPPLRELGAGLAQCRYRM